MLAVRGSGFRLCRIGYDGLMRILAFLLVLWFIIGALAGLQRHYYSGSDASCAKAGTVAVTILAGPLNYVGANPKITACNVPQPSS
jgi:hypothetical protein